MVTSQRISDRLLALYQRVLGEPDPERKREVYVGFALFFGGIALGVLGLAGFLWSAVYTQYTTIFWQLRELAITLAMLGLPAFGLSLVILLPVDRRARSASGVGAFICLIAAGVFVVAYPQNWNAAGATTDYSTQGITIYAAGLAVLAASTGAGLVAHRLERVQDRTAGTYEADETEQSSAGTASSGVFDERVRRDIEEAMEATDLTWGGIERDDSPMLTVDTDDADLDRSGFDNVAPTTTRSGDVEDAVSELSKLRGGGPEAATGDTVDDQAAALQQLRAQQDADASHEHPDGILARLKALFARLRVYLQRH